MSKNKLSLVLFILSFFFLNCAEEKPKVKVINKSEKKIDAYFSLKECACPVFSFVNILPYNETGFRSCSAQEYIISLKDSLSTLDTLLRTDMEKNYEIYYNGKCSIIITDQ